MDGEQARRRKGMPQWVKRMEPFRPGQIWSMDFMHDSTMHGRKLRILNVIDEASHQCLASIPEHGYPSWKLVMALDHLVPTRHVAVIKQSGADTPKCGLKHLSFFDKH